MDCEDVTRFAEADVKFHDIIYRTTDNERLIQLLYNLREQMYRYRVEYLKEKMRMRLFLQSMRELSRQLKSVTKKRR